MGHSVVWKNTKKIEEIHSLSANSTAIPGIQIYFLRVIEKRFF